MYVRVYVCRETKSVCILEEGQAAAARSKKGGCDLGV